jgi:hypothetical protein
LRIYRIDFGGNRLGLAATGEQKQPSKTKNWDFHAAH